MQQASSCRAGSPLVLWKAVIAHAFFWRLRGYGAKAFARRCHWGNRLCLFLAVSTRFHLQRAHLIKIALIGNFAFLWTLSLLNTSSALTVVFVSLSTAINNRASLTVFGKTPSPPRGGMWLEALSHLWRGNPSPRVLFRGIAQSQVFTSTSSRNKHLQPRARPPNEAATNQHRKRGARQNTNLAPKKKNSHRQSHITNKTWPPLPFSRCTHH